jgi:DNA-binding NarL/FixJ family response regulator
MKRKVTVLIAEPEPVVSFGLVAFLKSQRDWASGGVARSVPEARSCLQKQQPEVLLLDPTMNADEGYGLIREALGWYPDLRIVVFSGQDRADAVIQAFRAGASAYVTRQDDLEQVVLAIKAALAGQEYMTPKVQHILHGHMRTGRLEITADTTAILSVREKQVFALLGSGLGKQQIAGQLHLSPKTIDTHQQRIKDKLVIASCVELRRRAALHFHRLSAQPIHLPRPADGAS